MKIGFNEATAFKCKGQSLIRDLELCEKYKFDYIEIQAICLKEYLKQYTLTELSNWFNQHHLKPLAYNTLMFFNQRDTHGKQIIDREIDFILNVAAAIGMDIINTVPVFNIQNKTIYDIKIDAIDRLQYLSEKIQKANNNAKISMEFCGLPNCSINQFKTAYDIILGVNRKNVGLTLDTFQFHEMCSNINDLRKADGNKIFIYHINDCEDFPFGSCPDNHRLWADEGVINHKEISTALKDIKFNGVCSIEVMRDEYYMMPYENNIKKAKQVTEAFINKYFLD